MLRYLRRFAGTSHMETAMKRKSKYDREIKTTVGSAVEDALSEFESLGNELREWYDNMPESLQGSSKGDEVSEAADALEGIDTSIDVPEVVANLPVEYTERQNRNSRAARCGYACTMLEMAIQAAQGWLDENKGHEKSDDVEAFIDEAQSVFDEADGVSFPGMY